GRFSSLSGGIFSRNPLLLRGPVIATEFRGKTPDLLSLQMRDYRPAQPHFDDERTVLSARPVVPLEKIHHRRKWLLAGAFAIAMMLGAGSALLAWYLKLRSVPEPAPQVSQEEIMPAPLAVDESAPSASPEVESGK